MVADTQADREAEATSDVDLRPGDQRAPVTGPATGSEPAPDTDTGTAGDATGRAPAQLDTSAGEPAGTVAAPVAEPLPDGPLGTHLAAISGLDLAARPDAFAQLDAAIVAELRAIEDL